MTWNREMIARTDAMLNELTPLILEDICQVFRNAVKAGDHKTIIEIGNSIEFHRAIPSACGDKVRAEILFMKYRLEQRGEKWPIRRLANHLKWPEADRCDGFSRLRRLCVELKFPLAPSRQLSNPYL